MKYYPQLDSLRALSIWLVILYHAGFNKFSGGFVGVDVFFVLSGYLITYFIYEKYNDGSFNIFDFYFRRAKRLFPVIAVLIIFVFVISVLFYSPQQIKENNKSIFSIIYFFSNFNFWQSLNYFSTGTDLNPLVHMWSLSLEIQFYLFFPIIFYLILKYKKPPIIILSVIFFGSLFFAQFSGNLKFSFPFIQKNFEFYSQSSLTNFYLPFGRVWEFVAGSIVFFITKDKKIEKKILNLTLKIIGLILIFYAAVIFNENTHFPSFYTLIPVIGTSLIILGIKTDDFINKILINRFIVFNGLLSYSLYIFHQPIFSFGRIFVNEINIKYFLILSLITYLFSFFIYKIIEKPCRKIENKKKFLTVTLVFYLIFTVLSILAYHFPEKINFHSSQKLKVLNPSKSISVCDLKKIDNSSIKYCEFGTKNSKQVIALTGDSHSVMLYESLNNFFLRENIKGVFIRNYDCKRLFAKECLNQQNILSEYLVKNDITNLIIAFRWPLRFSRTQNNKIEMIFNQFSSLDFINLENDLKLFLDTFDEEISNIALINNVPEIPNIIYQNIKKQVLFQNYKNLHFSFDDFNSYNLKFDDILKRNYENYNYRVINVTDALCEEFKDSKTCYAQRNYETYYFDSNHLSNKGSEQLSRIIINNFKD